MESRHNPVRKWSFEYFYMIIMVIYMAQMTPETSRLVGGFTGDVIPLLVPVIPTLFLFLKYSLTIGKEFISVTLLFIIWLFAIMIKLNTFYSLGFISFHLFIVFSFFIAYTHIKIFGTSFSDVYEDIIVKFALLSIPLWLISQIPASHFFFKLFPESGIGQASNGTNLFYLYHWIDPSQRMVSEYVSIARNSGMTWEPGRYSIILCYALWNNLSNYGIKFKDNKNAIILLIALATTFSTTGYFMVAILYSFYYIKDLSLKSIIRGLFIVIPAFMLMMNLDFMGDKLENASDVNAWADSFEGQESYWSIHGGRDHHVSLDRIVSLSFEFENIKNDPILGYSRNVSYSWFGKTYSDDYSLTGGLLKVIGQYGLLLGLYFYYLLFKSSRFISETKNYVKPYSLAIIFLLSSVSYGFFGSAVFMTFWFFGAFGDIPQREFEK